MPPLAPLAFVTTSLIPFSMTSLTSFLVLPPFFSDFSLFLPTDLVDFCLSSFLADFSRDFFSDFSLFLLTDFSFYFLSDFRSFLPTDMADFTLSSFVSVTMLLFITSSES